MYDYSSDKKKASLGTIANAYQLMWLYNPRQKNCTLNRILAGPLRELSSPARKEKTVGFLTALDKAKKLL